MSSDAENRARAILLPGQELAEAAEPASPVENVRLPPWSYSGGTVEADSWAYTLYDTTQTIQQQFSYPIAMRAYYLTSNIVLGTLKLNVYYTTGIVESVDDPFLLTNFIHRFSTNTFPIFIAEMDYSTGLLTILQADSPIEQIVATYDVNKETSF